MTQQWPSMPDGRGPATGQPTDPPSTTGTWSQGSMLSTPGSGMQPPVAYRPPPPPGVGTDTRRTVLLVLGCVVGVVVIIVAIAGLGITRSAQNRHADFTGDPVTLTVKTFEGRGTLTLSQVSYVLADGDHDHEGIVLIRVTFTATDGELFANPGGFELELVDGGETFDGRAGYGRQDHLGSDTLDTGDSLSGTVGFDAPRGAYLLTYRPIGGSAVTISLTV